MKNTNVMKRLFYLKIAKAAFASTTNSAAWSFVSNHVDVVYS
jgi:hypothetical protein